MTIEEILQNAIVYMLAYISVCVICQLIVLRIFKRLDVGIRIKWPKHSKWKTKREPLYSVKVSDSLFNPGYEISKYRIGWHEIEGSSFFFTFFFVWPMGIWKFGYIKNEPYYIGQEVLDGITDLAAFYEEKDLEMKEQQSKTWEEWEEKERKKRSHLERLNDTYDKNYEKC